ncbi:MAG TPA: hypothetical protein VHF01_01535 [Candidatus Acidoferrum sp.]|nr:hypothetical protein [Candidatus Acidoferrum sp.]
MDKKIPAIVVRTALTSEAVLNERHYDSLPPATGFMLTQRS